MLNKRKNIPKIPRKIRSIRIARKFIFESEVKWLPVDPFALYEKYGWILISWGKAKDLLNDSDPLRLKKSGAEARTSIIRGTDTIITVFDETIEPFQRIRWTIAHEIGHIVLGHLHDFDKTAINRGGLTSKEYEVLEKEADFFASELLAPIGVLKAAGLTKSEEIKIACNLSKKAADNREKDIEWWGNSTIACEMDSLITEFFSDYLKPINICINPSFFPFFVDKNHQQLVEEKNMSHLYVTTDENGRFKKCPQCGNFDISQHAKYCKMCGLYLFNNCGAMRENRDYDDYCGQINPGDARYCEYCGEETVLLRLGLLKTWQELNESDSKVAAGIDPDYSFKKDISKSPNHSEIDDPFANFNISDDDLPF